MKKITNVKKVRWDPIIVKLADNKVKQKFCTHTNNQSITSKKANDVTKSQQRLSNEEFKLYLKSLFDNDTLSFKYQNPDAWISPEPEKKKKKWHF